MIETNRLIRYLFFRKFIIVKWKKTLWAWPRYCVVCWGFFFWGGGGWGGHIISMGKQIIQKLALTSAKEILALIFRQSAHNAAKIPEHDYHLFSVPLSQLSFIISRLCKACMLGWRRWNIYECKNLASHNILSTSMLKFSHALPT